MLDPDFRVSSLKFSIPELRSISQLTDDLSLPATLASTPDSVLSALEGEIGSLRIPSSRLNTNYISLSDEGGYTPSLLSLGGDPPESRSRV